MDIKQIFDSIEGDFNYPTIYNGMVSRFPSGSVFVEIGAYKGKSIVYLIMEAERQNKQFTITTIDNFSGVVGIRDKDLRKTFHNNIKDIKDKFTFIEGDSWGVARLFNDKSVDFVFVDGGHDYASVKNDILAWLPKIKKMGIIAGHDYNGLYYPDCVLAVDQIFGDKLNKDYLHEYCWAYEVNT